MKQLALVVPCYNEAEVLHDTHAQLLGLMKQMMDEGRISRDSHIYYVDDGSKDATWPLIDEISEQDSLAIGIKLSRNCGHQRALLAGIFTAEGDAVVTIDADLQDDIRAIPKMLNEYKSGHDVVLGVRQGRETDSLFKRQTALAFYRFMHLMGAEVVDNHADFRLLSRRAIDHLKEFKETNLFLRGIVPLLGFPTAKVFYDRHERMAGESKYPIKRMLSFALDGVTSFSMVPLRLIGLMGFTIFGITSVMSAWVLAIALFGDSAVPGWASTVLPTYFLGGIQIFCLGVIGEYLGKIYGELKARPRFIIEKTTR
ncbi:MAG: glycosyltransferase family 2 protein [Oceanococcus sp.]